MTEKKNTTKKQHWANLPREVVAENTQYLFSVRLAVPKELVAYLRKDDIDELTALLNVSVNEYYDRAHRIVFEAVGRAKAGEVLEELGIPNLMMIAPVGRDEEARKNNGDDDDDEGEVSQ